MPREKSSADTIGSIFQRIAASSPESKFRWAEYLLIVVASLNQLGWKQVGIGTELNSVVIPIVLLFVLAVVNSLPIPVSNSKRMLLILGELALVATASFLGTHRVYRHLYLIVIGKAALLLNRSTLIVIVLIALAQQITFVSELEPKTVHFVPLFPSVVGRQSLVDIEYVIYYALALLLIVFISTLLRSEQESRRRAEQMKLEMDSMTMTLERERIARDIHDSLGHALTGLNVQLQLAQKLQDSNQAKSREAIALARGFAVRAVADVRRAVRAVRDSYFDFPAAVKELADAIESNGDCKVTTNLDLPSALPAELSHNLFFLVQEALTNVQRHAHAATVSLQVKSGAQLELSVKDDGIGFAQDEVVPGFGIQGMQERVASLGGKITIASAPGKGTDISITIPMETAPTKDGSDDQSPSS